MLQQQLLCICVYLIAFITCQYATSKQRHAMERIIHGSIVDIADFPYQVALVAKRGDRRWITCGGSIIAPKLVFTAAHCTHISEFEERDTLHGVLVGANYLADPAGRLHAIAKLVKHPEFNFQDFDHDFAVVLLEEAIAYGARAEAVPVARRDFLGGTVAMASGWGRTESGRPSKYLRAASVRLEKWGKCQDYFPGVFHPKITRNMVCVKPSVQTTYFGDSGGPLVVDGHLVGLVSFGRKVKDDKKTTVFTRVRNFMKFVDGVLSDEL